MVAADRRPPRVRRRRLKRSIGGVENRPIRSERRLGRLPVLLKWLKGDRPDVVCLQELKTADDKFPRKELEKAGYGAVWHWQKSWNSVAILTRGQEPHFIRKGAPRRSERRAQPLYRSRRQRHPDRRPLSAKRESRPWPEGDYKLAWFRRLQEYASDLLERDVPVVLAGNYNVMPTDIDVYKPERLDDALFRPEVRRAYANLVAQGWTGAVRHLHPHERIDTFWSYWRNSFERDAGLQIDHLLLSPAIASSLQSADVRGKPRGWEHTSDHAPVMIEPDLAEVVHD
ncbi:exodeoxyribonuclease III [Rhizobium sp. SIMBA_035]